MVCSLYIDDMMFTNTGLNGTVVGTTSSLFYVDNGAVGSLDQNWLLAANQHLCDLFCKCVGLKPNTKKLKLQSVIILVQSGAIYWMLAINAGTKVAVSPIANNDASL